MPFKIIFPAMLIIGLAYKLVLGFLSSKQKDKPLPESVRDVYDEATYKRWREYSAERKRLRLIGNVFQFSLMSVLFATNILAWCYDLMPGNDMTKASSLILAYLFVFALVDLPFAYISQFKIEEKYGFNKSTKGTFVSDQIKNYILNGGLNVFIYVGIQIAYNLMGLYAIPVVYAFLALIIVIISMLTTFFQRIFNKLTPLEDGELRTILMTMFAKGGYQLKDIYVMDASRRTTEINAFCGGLGKFKQIVLYDNLVNNYSTGEIAAIFAHEFAHFKHRDTAKMTICSLLMMLVATLAIALFLFVPQISLAYGFGGVSIVFALITIMMSDVANPIMTLMGIPVAYISRKFERRADALAVDNGYGKEMIAAFKKMSKDELIDLNPHPIVVALEYSHPPMAERVDLIEQRIAANSKE